MKKKLGGMLWIYLIFTIVFGGVGIGMFLGFLLPGFVDARTQRNGIVTTATVVGYVGGVTVNEVPYYKITFEYLNENGELCSGATNSAYTWRDVEKISDDGTIEIKYDKRGHAIALNYRKSKSTSFAWIFLVTFGGVGVAMGVLTVLDIKKVSKERKLYRHGRTGIGTFVDARSNLTVNGVPKYFIIYTFIGSDRSIVTCKTRSLYDFHETEILRDMKKFAIKYIGERAVIVQDLYGAPPLDTEFEFE